jgi:hypothetical protein
MGRRDAKQQVGYFVTMQSKLLRIDARDASLLRIVGCFASYASEATTQPEPTQDAVLR